MVIDFPDGRGAHPRASVAVLSDDSSGSEGRGGERPGERNPKRARTAAEVKKSLAPSYDVRVPPPPKARARAAGQAAGAGAHRLTLDNSPTLRTLSDFEGDWSEKLALQRRLVERYVGQVARACDRLAVPAGGG